MRNDYCNFCDHERLAEQRRSFDFGHIFFIPLIPLGWYRHWHCAECGRNPRYRNRTSFKTLKIIGAASLIIVFFASFLIVEQEGDAPILWGFRTTLIVAVMAVLYWIIKGKNERDLLNHAKRAAVVPLSEQTCIYCSGELTSDASLCPACDVHIYR